MSPGSSEISMGREISDSDRDAYNEWERRYLYAHLKPPGIGDWLWNLMWGERLLRQNRLTAIDDTRSMGNELGMPCLVAQESGRFYARPEDYLRISAAELSRYENDARFGIVFPRSRYWVLRREFIDNLVRTGRYPNLVAAARERGLLELAWKLQRHYSLVERNCQAQTRRSKAGSTPAGRARSGQARR